MPINRDKKIIFIHNPKCGGTSIETALNMKSKNNHGHILEMEYLYGIDTRNIVLQSLCFKFYENYISKDLINECLIFSVVRNPYDRVLSDYYSDNRNCENLYEFLLLIQNILNKESDLSLMKFDSKTHKNHFLPQYKYLENSINTKKLNIILKFENLNSDFNKYIDNKITLPFSNKSNNSNIQWEEYYRDKPECIKIINTIYSKDFELYNYNKILI